MPFVSYWVFSLLRGKATGGRRLSLSAFASGYIGLLAPALLTAVELGIQPIIATGPDGSPLYAPYPLKVAVPVMAVEHIFLFCIAEGAITLLLFKYFLKHEPASLYALRETK